MLFSRSWFVGWGVCGGRGGRENDTRYVVFFSINAGTMEISPASFVDLAHPMQRYACIAVCCDPSHTLHPSCLPSPQLRHFFVSSELHFGVYALSPISPEEEITLAFDFRYEKWLVTSQHGVVWSRSYDVSCKSPSFSRLPSPSSLSILSSSSPCLLSSLPPLPLLPVHTRSSFHSISLPVLTPPPSPFSLSILIVPLYLVVHLSPPPPSPSHSPSSSQFY